MQQRRNHLTRLAVSLHNNFHFADLKPTCLEPLLQLRRRMHEGGGTAVCGDSGWYAIHDLYHPAVDCLYMRFCR